MQILIELTFHKTVLNVAHSIFQHLCFGTLECGASCDNSGVALPTYWPRIFRFIYENADEWGWDAQLFYDTFEYLISKIKDELDDDEALNVVEKFGEKMFLTHFQVGWDVGL